MKGSVVASAVGLLVLSASGPALADDAAVIASASSTAVVLDLAGQHTDSGAYGAATDGTTMSTTGSKGPALTALGQQSLLSAGVLVQDAVAGAPDGQGRSAACSGLVGPGAATGGLSLVGGDCSTGGETLSLNAGTLDLSHLTLVESGLLQGADAQLQQALAPVLGQILPALNDGLKQGLAAFGDVGLSLDLDAVTSRCSAGPDGASGSANLAGVRVAARVPGQDLTLLQVPVDPAPNTHVVTGLGEVSAALRATLKTTLSSALGGALSSALGPLAQGLDQGVMLDNALAQISTQLAPLEDSVVDLVLNGQSSTGAGQIEVSALDLTLLPAAKQFGFAPLRIQIGHSECGPTAALAPQVQPVVHTKPTKTPHVKKTPKKPPTVPTVVPAGLATAPGPDLRGPAYLATVALLAGGAGLARRRFALRR